MEVGRGQNGYVLSGELSSGSIYRLVLVQVVLQQLRHDAPILYLLFGEKIIQNGKKHILTELCGWLKGIKIILPLSSGQWETRQVMD